MHQALLHFLSQFSELSSAEVEAIAEHIPVAEFPKGTTLIHEGEVPQACYYVLQGCVRQYHFVEGEEKTTAFYTERNGTISSSDFVRQTPSGFFLTCVEDCLLICGGRDIDQENYEKFPVLKEITRQMVEEELNDTKEQFVQFVNSTPEERYRNLLKTNPDLPQRVPQHQIASLLGMTPESLSRIRKRILEKERRG